MKAVIATYNSPHRLIKNGLSADFQRLADSGVTLIGGQENTDADPKAHTPRGWRYYRPKEAQSAALYWNPDVWELTGDKGAESVWKDGLSPAPRYIVWADLRHKESGDTRRIGVVHLPAFKTKSESRARGFRYAERKAGEWLAGGPKRVLIGDFNASPGPKWMPTMLASGRHHTPLVATKGRTKIDHVWTSMDLRRAVNAKTMNGGSDHRALIVELPLSVVVKPEPPKEPDVTDIRWETRAEWGALPPRLALSSNTSPVDGVALHYGGAGPFKRKSHADCQGILRSWQRTHQADRVNNYSDIAYNLAVCHHGVVMECRSTKERPKVRTGANGNATANSRALAVVSIWGSKDGTPPDALLRAYGVAVAFLRKHADAAYAVRGHRDYVATGCPGDPIYNRRGLVAQYANDIANDKPKEVEDEDMPTAQEIAAAVWSQRIDIGDGMALGGDTRSAASLLKWGAEWSKRGAGKADNATAAVAGAVAAALEAIGSKTLNDEELAAISAAVKEVLAEAVVDVEVNVKEKEASA